MLVHSLSLVVVVVITKFSTFAFTPCPQLLLSSDTQPIKKKKMRSNNRTGKTCSYQLNRASSMEPLPHPHFTSPTNEALVRTYDDHVPKKPTIEYPTSPQLLYGQGILHFSHPIHPLSLVDLPDLYTCAGCKEYGSGLRFTCHHCDYQLHKFCALAPPSLNSHPFHFQHQLLFFSKPVKGGVLKAKCDVCGKTVKGFCFRCNGCSYQMHPCCAMLSNEINISSHPHPLKILPAMSVTNGDPALMCRECARKRSGRVYRCTVCEYNLHAVCAKNMINGLQANGIKGVDKPSMLGTAARLASQVAIEFIGGLIEGIGEGVGQAFISSVARGTPHVTRTNPY